MYNGKVIRKLLQERNLLQKDLLEYLYPAPQKRNGSIIQFEKGNPTVKTIENIADFFQVPIDVFFDRKKSNIVLSNQMVNNGRDMRNEAFSETEYKLKIESLEKLLEEKDKRIDLLEKFNQVLSGSNSK